MGTDVLLYAEIEVSPERLGMCEEFILKHARIHEQFRGHILEEQEGFHKWGSYGDKVKPRVEFNTLARHFGTHNHRGHWPQIHEAIRVMQACFPEADVFYGGDSRDEGALVTEELIAEHWGAWYQCLANWGVDPAITVWATRVEDYEFWQGVNADRYERLSS